MTRIITYIIRSSVFILQHSLSALARTSPTLPDCLVLRKFVRSVLRRAAGRLTLSLAIRVRVPYDFFFNCFSAIFWCLLTFRVRRHSHQIKFYENYCWLPTYQMEQGDFLVFADVPSSSPFASDQVLRELLPVTHIPNWTGQHMSGQIRHVDRLIRT